MLPACVTTARRLRKDPRVPTRVKIAVAFAGLWVLSPIDLIPEFLPVIGPLDDVVVVALALRYAARHIPPEALIEAIERYRVTVLAAVSTQFVMLLNSPALDAQRC